MTPFTLARKCATGFVISEGCVHRTVSCLPTALYHTYCLVFMSTISKLQTMISLYNGIHNYLVLTHLQHILSHTSTAVGIILTGPVQATSNFFSSQIILTIPTVAATYTRSLIYCRWTLFCRRMLTSCTLYPCAAWFMSLWYA